MNDVQHEADAAAALRPARHEARAWWVLLPLLLAIGPGCAALHPIEGIPASHVPPEFLGPSRNGRRTINPMLLTRARPCEHLVDAGDVLAVYIPGILGTASPDFQTIGEAPPINMPFNQEMPPTIGFPIAVRDDGTISLPQVAPIAVRGLSLSQVEQAVRRAYTEPKQILAAGKERILVSLQRPRDYRVLVVRQEASTTVQTQLNPGNINLGESRRGSARIVSLQAYENDVLHALARVQGADGLPGLDAENTIYVIRGRGAHCRAPQGAPYCEPGLGPQMTHPHTFGGRPHAESQTVVRFQSPADAYQGHALGGSRAQLSGAPRPQRATSQPSMHSGPSPSAARLPANPAFAPGGPGAGDYRSAGLRPVDARVSGPAVPPAMPHRGVGYVPPMQPARVVQTGGYAMQPPAMPVQPPLAPIPEHAMPPEQEMVPPHGQFCNPAGRDVNAYFDAMLMGDFAATIDDPGVIKIPVRLAEGEHPQISEQDVTLYDGDIVFIESRDSEVFYTGGLLGGGQYTLPRDYDLRVLEALSIAQSGPNAQNGRSIGGVSALNQDVTISASKVVVLRTLADGSRVPIEIDLTRAKQDMTGRENIIVQPGDYLFLQYSRLEAFGAFIERHLLEGALLGLATAQFQNNADN